jgi:hypothetical protein
VTAVEAPTIHLALSSVMKAMNAVAKDSENKAQGFKFRGIDAVMNACHGPLVDHGVIAVPVVLSTEAQVRETRNGGTVHHVQLTVQYDFHGPAGDKISAVVASEAFDSGDKATSKAMAMAFKYALFQVLCIPTNDEDADASSHELAARQTSNRQPAHPPVREPDPSQARSRPAPSTAEPPPSDPDGPAPQSRPAPTSGGGCSEAQLRMLHVMFNKAQITDDMQKKDYCHTVVGHAITSSKDLTKAEASKVINALKEDVGEE